MKLYVEEKEFTDENTGNPVTYRQVVLEADGIRVPIKATYKNDKRLLLFLRRYIRQNTHYYIRQ